jgi:thiol-disulfide isomerase/thioredoxin
MRKCLLILVFLPFWVIGQNSVSGKIEPSGNYSWILLYKMVNGKQIYLQNAEVKDGNFEFQLSDTEKAGVYRTYYQMDDQLFVEFLYNKQPVNFTFNPNNPLASLTFLNSEENQLYQEYFKSITKKQKKLDSVQVAFFNTNDSKLEKKLSKTYQQNREEVLKTQAAFELKSKDKLANHFISADRQYNAALPIKDPQEYLKVVKEHFFDAIDFKDSILSNSSYINDKIIDYIFYLNISTDDKVLMEMQKESMQIGLDKIAENPTLQKTVLENILKEYADQQNSEMVNYVLENYYNKLPGSLQDNAFRYQVLSQVKTAIGKKAPNISWEENGVAKDLYSMNDSDYYMVLFFSSTCSHCQVEVPEFYSFSKEFYNMKVIAIGLEDEKESWEKAIENLPGFTHILDLQKWDSEKVKDYGIMAIPSYFLLDKDKNIIAKPENVAEIKSMFEVVEE